MRVTYFGIFYVEWSATPWKEAKVLSPTSPSPSSPRCCTIPSLLSLASSLSLSPSSLPLFTSSLSHILQANAAVGQVAMDATGETRPIDKDEKTRDEVSVDVPTESSATH